MNLQDYKEFESWVAQQGWSLGSNENFHVAAERLAWAAWQKKTEETAALRGELAMLRAHLNALYNHIILHDDEGLAQHSETMMDANKALTATEATAREYERIKRNEVLEEVAERADANGPGIKANAIRAMKQQGEKA